MMHTVEIHTPITIHALMAHQSAEHAQRAYQERHLAQEVSGDLKHRAVTDHDRIAFERGLKGYSA